jgi:hypothetical protein
MKASIFTVAQSNGLLAAAAAIFGISPLLTRTLSARACLWVSLVATVIFIAVAVRGYESRLKGFLYSGLAVLISSWCAFGLWRLLLQWKPAGEVGIDPFAGPLVVFALSAFLAGIGLFVVSLWIAKRKGIPYIQRFFNQRAVWALCVALLLTFSYFAHLLEGV